jgi:hypothetical protein
MQPAFVISSLRGSDTTCYYLRQLATGHFLGKISHALLAVAALCLVAEDKEKGTYRSVQTAVNDVARMIMGHNGEDHMTEEDLLTEAKLPTVNYLVTMASAMEAWAAFHSSNGNNGSWNLLGENIFGGGSIMGYVSHALAAVASPRFGRQDDPQKKTKWYTTQLAIKDSARSIIGDQRSDRLSVANLLARAKVDSVNAHVPSTSS